MDSGYYCTVDIGGTKTLLALMDEMGTIIFSQSKPTPDPAKPEAIVREITSMLEEGRSHAGLPPSSLPSGAGICIAAFVQRGGDIVHQAPNLHWVEPVPLRAMLEDALKTSVLVENDANAALAGEVVFGAAQGHGNAIYITLSTGIGGGLYLDGHIYRGHAGFAGEIGHMKSYGFGRLCHCGGHDCLEAWASGSAMARSAHELWHGDKNTPQNLDAAAIFQLADNGNSMAQALVDNALRATAIGLANLVSLLNPSCLVLGGGIALNREDYYLKLESLIRKNAIRPAVDTGNLIITRAELGSESGIRGMFALLNGQVS